MWTEDVRPTLYVYWLIWQITIEHSSAEGVEPVKTMGPSIRFKGEVVIEYQRQVLEEARKYRTGIVMWTDGSKLDHWNCRLLDRRNA